MSKAKKTESFDQLFDFYHESVKPLYAAISADNTLPQEVLFEINAAFDHISRHWKYKENVQSVTEKAKSHLKRACLDIFKIKFKLTKDQYDEICKVDVTLIDNGTFVNKLHTFFAEIKKEAIYARSHESDVNNDYYSNWLKVYKKCIEFERDFYNHKALDWAKKRSKIFTMKNFIFAIATSYIAGSFSNKWILSLLNSICDFVKNLFSNLT